MIFAGAHNEGVLERLPPMIQKDILQWVYEVPIRRCPFFKAASDELVRRLCGVLKPYMAAENDQVVIEGSIGRLFAHIDIIRVRASGPPSPFMQRRDTILHKNAPWLEASRLALIYTCVVLRAQAFART